MFRTSLLAIFHMRLKWQQAFKFWVTMLLQLILESALKKTIFVKDLKVKENIQSLFLVKHIAAMESRDGNSYLNLILSDNTGDLESRKWSGAKAIVGKLSKGDIVSIDGKVQLYQGRIQLIVKTINKFEGEKNLELFIPKSMNDPEEMLRELITIVDELDDVYIRDLLKLILDDDSVTSSLKICQAGKSIHHAFSGGLLEHILSCTNLALKLSSIYQADQNYVIAGCILHDLCKIHELTSGNLTEYTDEGKLIGHLVKSAELLDEFALKIPRFPKETKMHLKHILISHHGEYEYGSPKLPQTSEALLVSLIDLLDSKMNSLETAKKNDKTEGNWTGFIKHLDRTLYKEKLPSHRKYLSSGAKEGKQEKEEKSVEKPMSSSYVEKPTMGELLKNFKVD